jgi:hypothetical protein
VLANYTENGKKMETGKNIGRVGLKARLKFGNYHNLNGRSDPSSCCPGGKPGADDNNGREKPSWFSLIGFRKETREHRDKRAETAEARIGERGDPACLGKANAFLPGSGGHLKEIRFSSQS